MTSTTDNPDSRAIAELLETHRQSFLPLDTERLGSIWDRQHEPLIYWRWSSASDPRLASDRGVLRGPAATPGGDAGDAPGAGAGRSAGRRRDGVFQFHAKVRLKEPAKLHEPHGRVTLLLRTPAGWRVIHYHESTHAFAKV